MFNQLAELKTIGGVDRLNFSIEFLANNTARVVITSQVNKSATGELADLLKRPIGFCRKQRNRFIMSDELLT